MSKHQYPVRIEETTKPALTELAQELNILVDVPGGWHGQPSVANMLDMIADAYIKNPGQVVALFKKLNINK